MASPVGAVVATLFLLGSALALVVPPAAAATSGSWTVLVYMDAEGTLEPAAIDNMLEMEHAGVGTGSRVLVQMDRGPGYDTRDGDWQGTHRYEIGAAASTATGSDTLASPVVEDLGESDMGDPATLTAFLTWGVARAPADHYLVILWDHGGAWNGLAWDEVPKEDHLTLDEMHKGLDDARKAAGIPQWDVVYFDACVMGSLEVAHAVGDTANVVIASEELVPGAGGAYRALLEDLRSGASPSADAMAAMLVDAYHVRYAGDRSATDGGAACHGACGSRAFDATYRSDADDDAVLSWYHTSKEPALWSAWLAFNDALKADAKADWPSLVTAAHDADHFHYADASSPNAMDIGSFTMAVSKNATDPALRSAADAVTTALDAMVAGHTTSPNHPTASGLMTKFELPSAGAKKAAPTGEHEDVYQQDSSYSAAAAGSRAISSAATSGDTAGPGFGEIKVEDVGAAFSITVPVLDAHPRAVSIAVTDEGSPTHEVVAWIQPTKLTPASAGLTAEFTWNGTVLMLKSGDHLPKDGASRGHQNPPRGNQRPPRAQNPPRPARDAGTPTAAVGAVVIAPAFRESLTSNEYILEGSYRTGAAGPEQDAFLKFDLGGNLLSAWVTSDLAGQVKPRPGDAFAPIFMGWDASGGPVDLVSEFVPAAGPDSHAWSLELTPLANGTTGFSAYAEDLAGHANLSDAIVIDLASVQDVGTPASSTPTPATTPSGTTPTTTTPEAAPAKSTPGAPLALGLVALVGVGLAMRRVRR